MKIMIDNQRLMIKVTTNVIPFLSTDFTDLRHHIPLILNL
jgi:hypothetical protein